MGALLALVMLFEGCASAAAVSDPPDAGGTVDAEAVVERAGKLAASGDYEGARLALLEAFEAGSRDDGLAAALAHVELLLGRADQAAGRLEMARVWNDKDPDLLLWSAVAAGAKGDGAQASGFLEAGLAAAGEDETALYDLAERFLRDGVPSVAAAVYEKIINIAPHESQFDVFSCLNLSSHYYALGRYAQAAEVMALSRKPMEFGDINLMPPQEIEYWTEVFRALDTVSKGEVDAGLDRLRDAAAVWPIGMMAEAMVVRTLDEAGRKDEADGVYALVSKRLKNALAGKPESAEAYHDIALFAALCRRDGENGLKYCQWALNLKPLAPEFFDTKAALLYELARFEESLRCQERAIALVSTPRWAEPGLFFNFQVRRLEILEKTGLTVPRSLLTLK